MGAVSAFTTWTYHCKPLMTDVIVIHMTDVADANVLGGTPDILQFNFSVFSLTKLMVSHDLLNSTVTKQITCDQRDSKSIPNSNARWTVVARRWFPNWKP